MMPETRQLPDALKFDGGPTLRRTSLIQIMGPAVFSEWISESGNTRVAYVQHVTCDLQGHTVRRGVVMVSHGQSMPPDAVVATCRAFMPDYRSEAMGLDFDEHSVVVAQECYDEPGRPSAN